MSRTKTNRRFRFDSRVDEAIRQLPTGIPADPGMRRRVRHWIERGFNPRLVANHVIFTWKASQDTV